MPTRELCVQIHETAYPYAKHIGVTLCAIFGGEPVEMQNQRIAKGCDILIGTPGRLLDFVEHTRVHLHRCTYFVLDEGDLMLDMGFVPQIKKILQRTRYFYFFIRIC